MQISERDGRSSLRLVVRELTVIEIASPLVKEVHLGDRIALDGSMRVETVRPLPYVDSDRRTT